MSICRNPGRAEVSRLCTEGVGRQRIVSRSILYADSDMKTENGRSLEFGNDSNRMLSMAADHGGMVRQGRVSFEERAVKS